MEKILIISININKFDSFKEPKLKKNENYPWIYITDNLEIKSSFYNVIYLENLEILKQFDYLKNDMKKYYRVICKFVKINSHLIFPNYKFYLFIDASFEITNKKMYNIINNFINNDYKLVLFKPNKLNSIQEEIRFCFNLRSIPRSSAKHLRRRYQDKDFIDNKLYETGIYFKKNCNEINIFCDEWFKENLNIIYRDQISLPFILWKPSFIINENIRNNKIFGRLKLHKNKT
jgi:hypothetical protein